MSDLRKAVIRLAHENPEMRADLIPLLKEAAYSEVQESLQDALFQVTMALGALSASADPAALKASRDLKQIGQRLSRLSKDAQRAGL